VLGLGEEHHFAAGAHGVHGGADEGVAADGENDDVGAAAIGGCAGALDHVFSCTRVDGMLEAEAGGNGVALGIEVAGEDLAPVRLGERPRASGRWGPGR
jgi:hypothetical protein